MATSGSFSTNTYGSFYFTISWWRTGYSSTLNEHYISYSVIAHNSPGSYRTVYHRELWINGSCVLNTSSGTKYYDGDTVFTSSLTIPSSDQAGNATIALSFAAAIGTTTGDNSWGNNGSGDSIDQIPRQAYITRCDNFYSDGDAYMEFNDPGGFSCNIRLEYGSSSRITRSVYTGYGGGYNFHLTNSEKELLLAACPSSNTLTIRYVVATLVNGQETMWSYYDRTMTVSDYEPTFSNCAYQDELSESIALTGSNQRIIKGYNNTKIVISTSNKAVAVKGASMVKYRAVCGSVSDEQNYSSNSEVKLTLPNIENASIDVYAIDSRGKSKKITKEISSSNWKNYSDPIVSNAYIFRTNSAGTQTSLSINGTFWNSSFNNSSTNNDFTLFRYRYKKTTDSTYGSYNNITPTKSGDNYSFSANINGDEGSTGFNSSFSYNIQLNIKDKIREITYDLILGAGKPLMAFQREGVSFGAPYDTTIGGPLQVTGKLTNTGDVNITGNLSYSGTLYKGTENILQRHIITLGKTTNQSISPNVSPVSVQFTGVKYKIGDKLSFSSYGVTVGAGVSYVLANGLAWVEANSGYKWLQLMLKRGNSYITLSSAITPKNTYEGWDSIALPSQLIHVEEGDYIYMTVAITGSGNGQVAAGTYGQQSTYMTVEVVE